MSTIINASEYAHQLMVATNKFLRENKKAKKEISEEQAAEIIAAIVDDAISDRMRWCRKSHYTANALERHLPWFNLLTYHRTPNGIEQVECPFSNDYYVDVLDKVECRVMDMVFEIIPDMTWDVWSMRMLGKDIAIMKGPDYRVLDWERRIASGEWKHDR